MKHLKTLWLAAIVLTAAMIFASTALATVVTSPKGTLYTSTLKGTSEGTVTFHGPVDITCEAALEGIINSHGTSVTAEGQPTNWEYIKCGTNIIHSNELGSIAIHSVGKGEGTITSSGTRGTATITSLGLTCVYTTSSTDLGVVTDSSITGGTATIHLEGSIPRTGGSIFCGSSAEMTGSATVTTPDAIFID